MTTAQNIDYCTGQCWYDNVVYSPADNPDVVYLGGSFDYNTVNGATNGRAVLMSTDGGATWSDVTRDIANNGWIHPDQHAIVTVPGKPLQFFEGDDGGVVRSSGTYVDGSSQCAARGLTGATLDYCKSLLNRIPDQTTVLNPGLSTLQFQSFSVNPQNAGQLMGGTQDNGTFQFSGNTTVWPQIIYGDGGQSGWNAANSDLRFNTFTGQANDANFRNGDPSAWVIIGGPIASSPEGALFYPPIIADPNKATAGSIFQGSQSVWRTQDWGGDQADLEANCPEFTTAFNNPNCGDFVQIGPSGATDLTSAAYGADRGRRERRRDRAGAAEHRHVVGGHDDRSRLHLGQRQRLERLGSDLDAARFVLHRRSAEVPELDLRRPEELEPRVDLLLRLQLQHADHTGSRVRGHPDWQHRDVDGHHEQPGRSSGHGSCSRRSDG